MIRYILPFLLCVSSAFAQNVNSLDPTQVYNTVNIVNNSPVPNPVSTNWQNVGLVNQGLPCWTPADSFRGAYCGPAPYFNQGTFNFSYGVTDVFQFANIAAALPNSGTGLRVNGYNFGFTAKNGNGWDGEGLDTLSAYVKFWGSDGKEVVNNYYNLNYKFNWTQFNFSKSFDSPYLSSDLSVVRYGFIGGDTSNYWAGPYGPEITNISFSLKYSVDPCYTNVLSSPSCPGYMEELSKITMGTTNASPVIETVAPVQTVAEPATTTTTTTTAQASTSEVTPAKLEAQNPISASSSENKSTSGPSLTSVLSMIKSNQDKENNIAMTAVAQANQVAKDAVAQAEQTALSVAGMSSSQSLDIAKDSMNSSSSSTKSNLSNNGLTLLSPAANQNVSSSMSQSNVVQQSQNNIQVMQPPAQSISAQQTSSIFQLVPPVNNNSQPASISPTQTTIITSLSSMVQQPNNNLPAGPIGLYTRPAEITIASPVAQQQEAQPLQENRLMANSATIQQTENINSTNSLFTKRGDPLSDYIEQNNILVAMAQPETKSTTVKTNVQDNDLAGGVRIERMAVTPVGFSVYSMMLRDAAFYQPKEIYKNVVIRDNVRTMYFIEKGNTDTYNKMLDQQYK